MNTNKICIYAICKNESQFIEKWLNSVKDADYIVVLDTGSDDDTYDKLISYAKSNELTPNSKLIVDQKVVIPWRFDTARNLSLEMAYNVTDANIFFCIDLDEIVHPGWNDVLKNNWLEGFHERGVYKYTWSHTKTGSEGRSFKYDKIHSRNWKWIYPVHEFLVRKENESGYNMQETLYLFDKIHVEHYPDNNKSRKSYLPLLKLRLEENPNDLTTEIYLGHEYYYRGFYNESIEILSLALNKLPPTGIDTANCYLFIGDCFKKLNSIDSAASAYYKSIMVDKTYIEPYISLANIHIDRKEYNLAVNILKSGLKNAVRHFSWLERDTSWSYEPWDLLSIASYYDGNKKDSLLYAFKAYSFDENDERLLNNINRILANTSTLDLL